MLRIKQSPKATMLFKDVHIFDPVVGINERGDLLVKDGSIAQISLVGNIEANCPDVVDGTGLTLFPGFVDPHVHLRTPGREDKEDIGSGTEAAAAGGFCKVLAMPNTEPAVDDPSVLAMLLERAGQEAAVEVGFFASITKGLEGKHLSEMAELAETGAVGFTDDGVPVADGAVMRQAFQYQRLVGKQIALHEEDPDLSGTGVMHEGAVSAELGMAGIPSISESSQIERDCTIAGYEDARCHILHLSCVESVHAVARAKERGVMVTAEVCPHHLALTDEAVRSLDPNFKMNPPLRSEDDRQALIEGLKSGVIDCIATDHAPHAPQEKLEPFEAAPMGVTGLETAFSVLYTDLVLPGILTLDQVVSKLTAGAEIFDLERPVIKEGEIANLCLVDLEKTWVVGADGYKSKSRNSCFAGSNMQSKVVMTLAAGQLAYRDESPSAVKGLREVARG